MRPVARQLLEDNHLLFLPSVFNETLGLLYDAHNYFQTAGDAEQAEIDFGQQSDYAAEMTRITMRLTSVMAWIMVRRAVTAGRIEPEKAAQSYRLDDGDICLAEPSPMLDSLPYYFSYLSSRSHELYERVHRLDEMAYGSRH